MGNRPLSDSMEVFFLWLFRVKGILGFAFFSQAEITGFGYENLSAQIVPCADFTPLIKFK